MKDQVETLIFAWKRDGDQVNMPNLDRIPDDQVSWDSTHSHAYVRVKPLNSAVTRHPENLWTDDSGEVFELACVGPSGNCRWTLPASASRTRAKMPEIAAKFDCRPWIETEPDGQGGRRPV